MTRASERGKPGQPRVCSDLAPLSVCLGSEQHAERDPGQLREPCCFAERGEHLPLIRGQAHRETILWAEESGERVEVSKVLGPVTLRLGADLRDRCGLPDEGAHEFRAANLSADAREIDLDDPGTPKSLRRSRGRDRPTDPERQIGASTQVVGSQDVDDRATPSVAVCDPLGTWGVCSNEAERSAAWSRSSPGGSALRSTTTSTSTVGRVSTEPRSTSCNRTI